MFKNKIEQCSSRVLRISDRILQMFYEMLIKFAVFSLILIKFLQNSKFTEIVHVVGI